jgi:hypothetical protein
MTRNGLIPSSSPHPYLVLLGVRDEQELFQTLCRLEALGITFKVFREPDRNNELTAIATAPLSGATRKLFKRYQCLQSAPMRGTVV